MDVKHTHMSSDQSFLEITSLNTPHNDDDTIVDWIKSCQQIIFPLSFEHQVQHHIVPSEERKIRADLLAVVNVTAAEL